MDEQLISDDELDALLAERDPINTTWLDARQVESALARLVHDICATSGLAPAPSRRPRVMQRLVAIAAAGVAVAAAALVGVSLLGGGSTHSLLPNLQLPVAQAAQLDRIAQATAAGPSAGHGKWLYVELMTTEHQGLQVRSSPVVFYSVTETVQNWSASARGPTRVRVTFSHFDFASAHARAVYESHRSTFAQALAPLPLAPGHIAVADATFQRNLALSPTDIGDGSNSKVALASLPADPQSLVKFLGREKLKGYHPGSRQLTGAQRRQRRQFVIDNQALGEWDGLTQILIASTSAQQRAEAYRALTLVRFVHVLGERRDSRGRQGIAVSFQPPGAGSRTATLIVDPRTGDLLEESSGTGSVGVWLARAAVDSDTDLPGGGKEPASRSTPLRSEFPIFRAIAGGLVG
jgi:hypothetical protein